MEENPYSGIFQSPRRRCCRLGTQLALVGLLMAALWAALLTLLLLWHWETGHKLKQLEVAAARNVSQISKDLQRSQRDQKTQRAQAAQLSQGMQELQAEQEHMKSQASLLSQNLGRLQEDLSDFKSLNLNERRADSDSLERLQEEVAKLRMEILVSKGFTCTTCPEQWLSFQHKCYYFGRGAKRWVQARFTCSDLEGRLVSIHSPEEQAFLTKHASKKGSWIGLRDLDMEGEFIWMDESPLDYSNWRSGEPNNGGQGEDCVMMLGSGQWNDAFCHSLLDSWVCERLATCEAPGPVASVGPLGPAPTTQPQPLVVPPTAMITGTARPTVEH